MWLRPYPLVHSPTVCCVLVLPLAVKVWNSNPVQDEFMGQVVLAGGVKDTTEPQRLRLRKRDRRMADEMPGTISLRIVTSTQLLDM